MAVLLVGLVLLLNALEASEPLHKLFHHDADQPGHECAITLFAHGNVELASVDVPVVVPTAWIETTAAIKSFVPTTATAILPPGRAPPTIISSPV